MFEIEEEFEKEVEKEIEKEIGEIEKETLETCPECRSPRLKLDCRRGEVICQDCGLVIQDGYIDKVLSGGALRTSKK